MNANDFDTHNHVVDTPCTDTKVLHYPTSSNFKARFNGPPSENLTLDQQRIQRSILQSRPKTGLSGPFGPWLANPNICSPAQELGKVCRYGTSLTRYQSEIVILLTAARHYSHTEFDIHVNEALDAGVPMNIICHIPRDDKFTKENIEKDLIPLISCDNDISLIRFVVELLLKSGIMSDDVYNETRHKVGNGKDEILVEITSIVGYYTFVAYTLNVFQIPSIVPT